MLRNYCLLLVFLASGFFAYAQEAPGNVNDFKYVIVPVKFDFLKEADDFQLNSLTKFLFEKYGFTAVMESDDMPADYRINPCLGLKSNVIKESGLLKTKLLVELKDCRGDVIYTSKLGQSREKQFKMAYHEALRDAFSSISELNYEYVPNDKYSSVGVSENVALNSTQKEIEALKAEIEQLKSESANTPETPTVQEQQTEHETEVGYPAETVEPKEETSKQQASKVADVAGLGTRVTQAPKNLLYAQATEDGYQLVDSSPKVVYRLKRTGSETMFLVESVNGVLTKKDSDWVLEYYDNGTLKREVLHIKF